MKTIIFVLLAFSLSSAHAVDEWSAFIKEYGKPDNIKSSENEKPRPPIVTRQAIYKKQGVRFVFMPNLPAGSPPPYKEWKFYFALGNKTKKGIKSKEVLRRFGK